MLERSEGGAGAEGGVLVGERQGAEGWQVPRPERVPPPSYWPAVLAFGAALVGFGVLTSYVISLVGAVLFILAATRWVGEMCREE